jgi:hypothetical protein
MLSSPHPSIPSTATLPRSRLAQVNDKVWVGGVSATEAAGTTGPGAAGADYSVDFTFGCQFYETGLFRTQKADGIMGMSSNTGTLVPKLQGAGKIKHRAFSLCFRIGGGNFAIGGATTAHHKEPMTFAPLSKVNGWFTVKLNDVLIGGDSIGVKAAVWNTGKGTIVDSGTTDTCVSRSGRCFSHAVAPFRRRAALL